MAISLGPVGNAALVPSQKQATLSTNYIDFTDATTDHWAQQYMPDLVAQESEIFGNRTISGFLSKVSAEESMSADQVIWTEQGRLHLSYKCKISTAGTSASVPTKITLEKTIDGNGVAVSATVQDHGVRVNDTVIVANANHVAKGYVTLVAGNVVTVAAYGHTHLEAIITTGATTTEAMTLLVYGSEYAKGTDKRGAAVEPTMTSYDNKPIILKDQYEVSGSDASQIGWIEVAGEGGQSGYLWYLKAEGDTRTRFTDYIEMSMLESEKAAASSGVLASHLVNGAAATSAGTEGMFKAIETRGNVGSGLTTAGAFVLQDFDDILTRFDEQGAIEEYMMYVDRNLSLAMDDMLATINSGYSGGTSYGVFDNDKDMALNLGFSGFRRGSYDFYKTDWKYLNDKGARGGMIFNDIKGAMIPAGVSSVYDQNLGRNLKRPFLHVRYRASKMENRKLKTWTTGSVGGNVTSALDAMEMHYLSERCLITQGANNFMLLKA
jgi:hypothetical protein